MNERVGNLLIGTGGTVLAFLTNERAAIFAGCATGIWMLTQTALALVKHFRK